MRLYLVLFCALWVAISVAAHAQDASDEAERAALAEKLGTIKPVREQVQSAVEQIVRTTPPDQQALFRARMLDSVDFNALEKVSADAMAEIFTAEELEAMIAYFGSEEGRSIIEKMPIYQELMRPAMVKELDKALMEVRTGKAAD